MTEVQGYRVSNGTYGLANCMSMASNSPADAVNHADCIEYFSENPNNLSQSTDGHPRADFNDDGKADLRFFEPSNYTTYVSTSSGSSFVWSGNWSNSFGWNKDQFFQGDFNGDGLTDLGYFELNNTFHVSISTGTSFGGSGSGQWINQNSFGNSTGRYIVGDFNGDRRSDLAYFDPATSTVSISTSTGTSFNGPHSGEWIPSGQFGWQAANYSVGDFDGDGITDIGYGENDGTYWVNISTGTGLWGANTGVWYLNTRTTAPYYIGDFNGDGKSDLGFFRPSHNSFNAGLSNGTTFGISGQFALEMSKESLGADHNRYFIGDFDGDNKDDVGYQETSDNSFKASISGGNFLRLPTTWVQPNSFGHSGGTYGIGQSN